MKKYCFIIITTLIFSVSAFGQKEFQKGYFIDNSGTKTACFIQNQGWLDNPLQFKYKMELEGVAATKSITEVKSFAIGNAVKFERHKVKIDRSSERIDEMSNTIDPEFNEETLFLKVLVEGIATLYSYEEKGLYRYFYKINDAVEQLVYKSYITEDRKIKENNGFRGQLWDNLKIPGVSQNRYKNLKYDNKDLISLFEDYNSGTSNTYTTYKEEGAKGKFNITIRPGIKQASFEVENPLIIWREMRFDNEVNFRFGVELEYVLPFNTNKWAIALEPTYSYYKSEKTIPSNSLFVTGRADYKAIELPISLRHYFFLNKTNSLFVNASLIADANFNSSFTLTRSNGTVVNTFDVRSNIDVALGGGLKINNRYSAEIRYAFRKDIIDSEATWSSKLSTLSFILGYTLF